MSAKMTVNTFEYIVHPSSISSPAPPSTEAYLSAACNQLGAVLTDISLSHHRVSPSEFLIQYNSTVLKIVLSQTSNGHINLEPLHNTGRCKCLPDHHSGNQQQTSAALHGVTSPTTVTTTSSVLYKPPQTPLNVHVMYMLRPNSQLDPLQCQ